MAQDGLIGGLFSPPSGVPLLLFGAETLSAQSPREAIVIAVDRGGALPAIDSSQCDVLITTRMDAPQPWVSVPMARLVEDPTRPTLALRGEGRCFSTGGDLAEVGCASDLAAAHVVRNSRSCAALLHRLGNRVEVRLHGACIGSGIEIAAACTKVSAATNTFVHLPELRMGLIPGAGGTVTLPCRIGRHRTAWLALSGLRIGATQARLGACST